MISDQIRQLITRGALSPGVHLGQTELAERFNASRVPVREALKLLAAEGVVVHDPNRGFFVATLSSDEARQFYRMRHLVEGELISTIRWPSPKEVSRLNDIILEMEERLRKGDRTHWNVKHREFHKTIFDLSPQKVLVREVLRLWALTDRYRSLLPPPSLENDAGTAGMGERALVKALERKDRAELARVFHEDRARIEKMLLSILEDRRL